MIVFLMDLALAVTLIMFIVIVVLFGSAIIITLVKHVLEAVQEIMKGGKK